MSSNTRALFAHTVSALSLGVFLVVVPWLALEEGYGISGSAISLTAAWLPYLLSAPFAALAVNRLPPLRVAGIGLGVVAAASGIAVALPSLLSVNSFKAALVAALLVGSCMPFIEGAVLVSINCPENPSLHMRRYALRTVLARAGNLVGSSGGLLVLHYWGVGVLLGIAVLVASVASAIMFFPRQERQRREEPRLSLFKALTTDIAATIKELKANEPLRKIILFHAIWAVAYSFATALILPILHDYFHLSTTTTSIVVLSEGAAVVFATYFIANRIREWIGIRATLISMVFIQAVSLTLLLISSLSVPLIIILASGLTVSLNVFVVAVLSERGRVMPAGNQGFMQVTGQWLSYLGYVAGTLLIALLATFIPLVELVIGAVIVLMIGGLYLYLFSDFLKEKR